MGRFCPSEAKIALDIMVQLLASPELGGEPDEYFPIPKVLENAKLIYDFLTGQSEVFEDRKLYDEE